MVTDDNQVTWNDIHRGMLSSSSLAYIPNFETVYTDYIYKDADPTVAPFATVAPSSEQRGDGPSLTEPTVAPSSEQRGKGPTLPEAS